jgi:hypothetical protein
MEVAVSITTRTERLINALLALMAFSALYAFTKAPAPPVHPTIFEFNNLEVQPPSWHS